MGFVVIFFVIGVATSMLGGFLLPYVPFLELFAGIAVIVIGIILIFGIDFYWPSISKGPPERRGYLGMFLFGAIYGIATFGCSAPIFFSTLFYALTIGGTAEGIVTFTVYSAGVGLPLIVTTVLVAEAKDKTLKWIVGRTLLLRRISGLVVLAMGAYLVYFYLISTGLIG